MKIRRIVIIVLVLSLISLYVFAFKMQASEKGESTLISFDKDGFVDSNLLTDTNKLVADNSNFSLYINETTSYFKVLDILGKQIRRSQSPIQRYKNRNQH